MIDYQRKKTLQDVNPSGLTVLLRADLNVPVVDSKISDLTRIKKSLKTIDFLLANNNRVILISHLGRIKKYTDLTNPDFSLKPVAAVLQSLLPNFHVQFESSLDFKIIHQRVNQLLLGQILLLENTRFYDFNSAGERVDFESKNAEKLKTFYASLADCFVNDAFGSLHRAHASVLGISEIHHNSCIGFLVEAEIKALQKLFDNPKRPLVSILGGSKVADKLPLVKAIAELSDTVLIGGGISYTFQKMLGYNVGKSIVDDTKISAAAQVYESFKHKIILPVDNVCTTTFADLPGKVFEIGAIPDAYEGLDIGPKTIHQFSEYINQAGSVFWNGPVGVSEFSHFSTGTRQLLEILKTVVSRGVYVVIGGGDSASAAVNFGYESDMSFISTGGGASLHFLGQTPLPGLIKITDK